MTKEPARPSSADAIWQELKLPDEAKQLDANVTVRIAQSDYDASASAESTGDDEQLLPLGPERDALLEALAKLPRLTVSDGKDGDVDLRVDSEIGKGGMGVVHLAHQYSLDRPVAIKRIRRKKRRQRAIRKLLAEAQITGSLDHPSVIPVHTLGRDRNGEPVLVMKRVVGVLWRDMICDPDHPRWQSISQDPLTWQLSTLVQVCHAMEFAHSRGVVHRDLKPENVMVGDFGEVYVLDWGLALRLVQGIGFDNTIEPAPNEEGGRGRGFRVVGTPAYMAPEMVNRGQVTVRTDVYLLGAILHHLLTGETRHRGDNFYDLIHQIYRSEASEFGPTVPAELGSVCNRATHREPLKRFATVRDFREAVQAAMQHHSAARLTEQTSQHLRSWEKMRQQPSPNLAALGQLATECRFGFQQALEMWPDNSVARAQLDRCLAWMIEDALTQQNVGQAESLFAELDEPQEELKARIDSQRRHFDVQRRSAKKLEELDVDVLSRARAVQFLALLSIAVVVAVVMVTGRRLGQWELSYEFLLPLGMVPPVLLAAVIFFAPKRRMRNRINRRLLWAWFAVLTMVFVLRWLGFRAGLAVDTTLMFELAASAMTALAAAILIDHRLLKPAGLCALCTVFAGFWPSWSVELAVVGTIGGLLWVALIWYRAGRGVQLPNNLPDG